MIWNLSEEENIVRIYSPSPSPSTDSQNATEFHRLYPPARNIVYYDPCSLPVWNTNTYARTPILTTLLSAQLNVRVCECGGFVQSFAADDYGHSIWMDDTETKSSSCVEHTAVAGCLCVWCVSYFWSCVRAKQLESRAEERVHDMRCFRLLKAPSGVHSGYSKGAAVDTRTV